jgi:hypothetical protein
MRESCMYGSARGALSNGRPYRNRRNRHLVSRMSAASAVTVVVPSPLAFSGWCFPEMEVDG